jgi:hypothetical protein
MVIACFPYQIRCNSNSPVIHGEFMFEIAFLDLVVLAFVVVMFFGIITQILIPIGKGTPLFPLLISKHRKLSEELSKAKDEVETSALEQEVLETLKKAKTKEEL